MATTASKKTVVFGALVDPLHQQLRMPRARCQRVQVWADQVTHLHIAGLLTEGEVHKVRKRLLQRIRQLVP